MAGDAPAVKGTLTFPVGLKLERTVLFVGDTADWERHKRRTSRIETIAQGNFLRHALEGRRVETKIEVGIDKGAIGSVQ